MGKYIFIKHNDKHYIILSDNTVFMFWDDMGVLYFMKMDYKYGIGKFKGYEVIGSNDMPLTLITDYLATKIYKHINIQKYNLHFMCPTHDNIIGWFNSGSFRLSTSLKKGDKKNYIIEVKICL